MPAVGPGIRRFFFHPFELFKAWSNFLLSRPQPDQQRALRPFFLGELTEE